MFVRPILISHDALTSWLLRAGAVASLNTIASLEVASSALPTPSSCKNCAATVQRPVKIATMLSAHRCSTSAPGPCKPPYKFAVTDFKRLPNKRFRTQHARRCTRACGDGVLVSSKSRQAIQLHGTQSTRDAYLKLGRRLKALATSL